MERSDDRQSTLIPATWMMDLNGNRPGLVSAAPPKGMRLWPELPERLEAATPLDRTGDALREEQPPRDEVPIPGVDDDLDVLPE